MVQQPTQSETYQTCSFQIPPEHRVLLDTQAREEDRSFSAVMRRIVVAHLTARGDLPDTTECTDEG